MISLLLSFSVCEIQRVFMGNWNITSLIEGHIIIPAHSQLLVDFNQKHDYQNYSISCARFLFLNLSPSHIPSHSLYTALEFSDHYTFISFFPLITNRSDLQMQFITKISENANITDSLNKSVFINSVYSSLNKSNTDFSVIVFDAEKYNETKNAPYLMSNAFRGKFVNGDYYVDFEANEYSYVSYLSEGKMFAVFIAFYVLFLHFIWSSIEHNFRHAGSCNLLSSVSFICHSGFDLMVMVFFLDSATNDKNFLRLYFFVFLCFVVIFSQHHINFNSKIWRAHHSGDDDDNLAGTMGLFAEMLFILFIYMVIGGWIKDYPLLSLFLAYSFFIPQIIHNATIPTRKTKDIPFTLSYSFIRICFLYYITMHKGFVNIIGGMKAFIMISSYLILQVAILLAQDMYSNSFFLPSTMKPEEFDYTSITPEPGESCAICLNSFIVGEDTMVTPCGHSFHRECLVRWFLEEPICPICRSQLPPVPCELL